ncbi:MAG: hypothetical protein ACUVT2_12610 [Thiobacillaceae bacterium]
MVLVLLLLLLVLGHPLLSRGRHGTYLVLGREVTLRAGERVPGDLVVVAGSAHVARGTEVQGDAIALGGSLTIGGHVRGEAVALGGDVQMEGTGSVGGRLAASGRIPGPAGASTMPPLAGPWFWFGWPWGVGLVGNPLVRAAQLALGCLVVGLLGTLLVLVAPHPLQVTGRALQSHPWQSLIVGLLAALLGLVGLPVLAITLIGLPLAAGAFLLLSGALALGLGAAASVLGQRLLGSERSHRASPTLSLTTGLLILTLGAGLPCLGVPLLALAGTWGLGAVLLTRFGRTPYRPAPPRVL